MHLLISPISCLCVFHNLHRGTNISSLLARCRRGLRPGDELRGDLVHHRLARLGVAADAVQVPGEVGPVVDALLAAVLQQAENPAMNNVLRRGLAVT